MKVVEDKDDGRVRGGDAQQRNNRIEECITFGVRIRAGWCSQIG